MRAIRFSKLGREGYQGTVPIPDGTDADGIVSMAAKEAQKHLLTAYSGTTYDEKTNEGKIYASFHIVGTFTVDNSIAVCGPNCGNWPAKMGDDCVFCEWR